MSTLATYGRGVGIVGTGMDTEIGKIAKMLMSRKMTYSLQRS